MFFFALARSLSLSVIKINISTILECDYDFCSNGHLCFSIQWISPIDFRTFVWPYQLFFLLLLLRMTSDISYHFLFRKPENNKSKWNNRIERKKKCNAYWEMCFATWRCLVVSSEWHIILSVFWIVGFFFLFRKGKKYVFSKKKTSCLIISIFCSFCFSKSSINQAESQWLCTRYRACVFATRINKQKKLLCDTMLLPVVLLIWIWRRFPVDVHAEWVYATAIRVAIVSKTLHNSPISNYNGVAQTDHKRYSTQQFNTIHHFLREYLKKQYKNKSQSDIHGFYFLKWNEQKNTVEHKRRAI